MVYYRSFGVPQGQSGGRQYVSRGQSAGLPEAICIQRSGLTKTAGPLRPSGNVGFCTAGRSHIDCLSGPYLDLMPQTGEGRVEPVQNVKSIV
jgi:hypothetical protein